jgi:tetratricopeptide (TPR) repeat protein
MVDVALWSLARHGLVEVDLDRPERPLQQHRVLRELIQDRMGPEALQRRLAELRQVLGTYTPGTGNIGGQPPNAELAGHLSVLEPWNDPQPVVRDWVLLQLQGLMNAGDSVSVEQAVDIGRRAEKVWEQNPESPHYLRLLDLLCYALLVLSEFRESDRYARRALRGQRAVFGLDNPRTLLTSGAYGGILRIQGQFHEARVEERQVVRRLTELLGPHHVATLQTEHNLAITEVLVGAPHHALELLQSQFNRRLSIGGEDDPTAWKLVGALAYCHRALGQNRESFDLLKEFLRRQNRLAPGRRPSRPMLHAEANLATTERRLGRLESAFERNSRLLDEFVRYQGNRYLGTLSCRFSLATDLHLLEKHSEATEAAASCLSGLRKLLTDDHPYTHICLMLLSVCKRAEGQLDEALRLGEQARDGLHDRLGTSHPWVCAADIALANTLVELDETDRAKELEQAAQTRYDQLGMTQHPDRELVTRNLAYTLAQQSHDVGPSNVTARRADVDLEIPGP